MANSRTAAVERLSKRLEEPLHCSTPRRPPPTLQANAPRKRISLESTSPSKKVRLEEDEEDVKAMQAALDSPWEDDDVEEIVAAPATKEETAKVTESPAATPPLSSEVEVEAATKTTATESSAATPPPSEVVVDEEEDLEAKNEDEGKDVSTQTSRQTREARAIVDLATAPNSKRNIQRDVVYMLGGGTRCFIRKGQMPVKEGNNAVFLFDELVVVKEYHNKGSAKEFSFNLRATYIEPLVQALSMAYDIDLQTMSEKIASM